MTVNINKQDGKTVVTVNGELDSFSSDEFQKELAPLMGQEGLQVELDLAGVEYIASKGLRVILALAQSIMPNGGSLKVVNLSPAVREAFDLTGFSSMFL